MASIGTRESSIAIGFAFPILGGICVALRFYTRRHLRMDLLIDDWLCVPAWFFVTGTCVTLLIRSFHVVSSDPDSEAEQRFTAQILGALAILWGFANALVKLSILFFYQRMFQIGRAVKISLRFLICVTVLWLVYDVIGWLLYCGRDLRANFEGPWYHCPIWGFEFQIGVFVLDSLLDLCTLVFPIPLLWKLHLTAQKKILLVVVFVLGGFAFFAGLSNTIVQGAFLVQPDFAEKASGGSFFGGASILIYNWPTIEIGVGLIACNLPSLNPCLVASLPHRIRDTYNTSWRNLRKRAYSWSSGSSSKSSIHDRTHDLEACHENNVRVAESGKQKVIAKSVSVMIECSDIDARA